MEKTIISFFLSISSEAHSYYIHLLNIFSDKGRVCNWLYLASLEGPYGFKDTYLDKVLLSLGGTSAK